MKLCLRKEMRKNSRGSCELQTMHGAFKKGFEKSDLMKIIQGASVFMTLQRREDLVTETESTQFSQCFCCTRYECFITATKFPRHVLDFH